MTALDRLGFAAVLAMAVLAATPTPAQACGCSPEVGKTYLVFGLGDSIATMRAEKCTLTAPLAEADQALEMLKGAGYRPRQPLMR